MAMNEKLVIPAQLAVVWTSQSTPTAPNMLNDRLGRVANLVGGTAIVFDAGSAITIDTAALLATNSPGPGIQWAIQGFATLANAQNNANELSTTGAVSSWASAEAGKRLQRQAVAYLPPVPARYYRLTLSSDFSVGRLVLGKAFTAADTMDIGYSFKVYDLGSPDTSPTGLDNPTIRGKGLEYTWVWSWMSEAEARGALLDLLAVAGITRDVLCILNPDAPDLHNVIGYGKLQEEVEGTNVAGGSGIPNAYEARFRLRSRLILNL